MAFSQNLRTRIAITPESTWGTTPATPAYDILPVTSFGLNLTKNELKDTAFHADRMQRYSLSGRQTLLRRMSTQMLMAVQQQRLAKRIGRPAQSAQRPRQQSIARSANKRSKNAMN